MAGIFPATGAVASQTTNGLVLTTAQYTGGCDPLFYSRRCTQSLDSAAQNAVISEMLNVMLSVGHVYDCNVTTNLAAAIGVLTPRICSLPAATAAQVASISTDNTTVAVCIDGESASIPYVAPSTDVALCQLPTVTQAEVDAATTVTYSGCIDGVASQLPAPTPTVTNTNTAPAAGEIGAYTLVTQAGVGLATDFGQNIGQATGTIWVLVGSGGPFQPSGGSGTSYVNMYQRTA